MSHVSFRHKPSGLLKWFYGLPRYLFRWHLGWVLGQRFLLITHVGRKTGKLHQTVVEVVWHDPAKQEYVVVSGYGTQSDWYQNIRKHPAISVQVGNTSFAPIQKFLSTVETFAVLDDYRHHHATAFAELCKVMGYPYDGTDDSLRNVSEVLKAISFQAKHG